MSLTQRAHSLVRNHFADKTRKRRLAVDATCGNGHDTVFLATMDFEQVIGFEIQELGIINTRNILNLGGFKNVGLVLDGHETMARHIPGQVDCFMFNLGFIPGGNKSITTCAVTTVTALTYATRMLSPTGIISLLCYPGHREGMYELRAIQKWLGELGKPWKIKMRLSDQPSDSSPVLYSITHKDPALLNATPKPASPTKPAPEPKPATDSGPAPRTEPVFDTDPEPAPTSPS